MKSSRHCLQGLASSYRRAGFTGGTGTSSWQGSTPGRSRRLLGPGPGCAMEIRLFEVPGWPNARRCARLETYVVIDETHGAHIVERRSPPCIEKHVGEGFDQTRSRATGSCRGRVVATRFAQRPERLPDTRMGGVRRGDPSRGACRCQGPRLRTHRGIFHRAACQAVGVRIIGSRFQGWATGYLGFNRLEEISSRVAVAALVDFAFGPLGCLHLEFRDRPWRTPMSMASDSPCSRRRRSSSS